MKIAHESKNTIDINLGEGKTLIIMYNEKGDELSFSFLGGQRELKQLQNRSDGYSGATFSKAVKNQK